MTNPDRDRKITKATRVPRSGIAPALQPPPLEMPSAPMAEEAVLGAVLLMADAFPLVSDFLEPEHFYKPEHQAIYTAITALSKAGSPINTITVGEGLRSIGKFEFAGGYAGLMKLTDRVSSAAGVDYHGRIILERAIKRQIADLTARMHQDAYEPCVDAFSALDDLQDGLVKINQQIPATATLTLGQQLAEGMDEIQERGKAVDGLTGVGCGFMDIDRKTHGLQRKELTIVAARPGQGKTAFALNVARNASLMFKKRTVFFSHEMPAMELILRMLSNEAEVDSDHIKSGRLTSEEWGRLSNAVSVLSNIPLSIYDNVHTVKEMRLILKKLKPELVIIDFLQIIQAEGNFYDPREALNANLKGIDGFKKEFNCAVLALSQLSRELEKRADKKPMLSDLAESGKLEWYGQNIAFLYRPEYYGIRENPETGQSTAGVAEFIIAKARSGKLGTVDLSFQGQFARFRDMSSGEYNPPPPKPAPPPADNASFFPKFPTQPLSDEWTI